MDNIFHLTKRDYHIQEQGISVLHSKLYFLHISNFYNPLSIFLHPAFCFLFYLRKIQLELDCHTKELRFCLLNTVKIPLKKVKLVYRLVEINLIAIYTVCKT